MGRAGRQEGQKKEGEGRARRQDTHCLSRESSSPSSDIFCKRRIPHCPAPKSHRGQRRRRQCTCVARLKYQRCVLPPFLPPLRALKLVSSVLAQPLSSLLLSLSLSCVSCEGWTFFVLQGEVRTTAGNSRSARIQTDPLGTGRHRGRS